MDSLFANQSSGVLALGAGALGCLAAQFGAESDEGLWAAAHVNSAELIATGLDKKLFLKSGGLSSVRALSRSLAENESVLNRMVLGCDAVVLCGELSDDAAASIVEALSASLIERGLRVFALMLEPFSPNGPLDPNALDAIIARLERSVPLLVLLNPGLETVSAGVAVTKIRKLAAERLGRAAQCLCGALISHDDHATQLCAMRGRYRTVFAVVQGSASQALDAALSRVDDASRDCLSAAVVKSAADLSYREMSAIKQKLNAVNADGCVFAAAGPALEGQAECLLLSGRRKPSNVVRIETGR